MIPRLVTPLLNELSKKGLDLSKKSKKGPGSD